MLQLELLTLFFFWFVDGSESLLVFLFMFSDSGPKDDGNLSLFHCDCVYTCITSRMRAAVPRRTKNPL